MSRKQGHGGVERRAGDTKRMEDPDAPAGFSEHSMMRVRSWIVDLEEGLPTSISWLRGLSSPWRGGVGALPLKLVATYLPLGVLELAPPMSFGSAVTYQPFMPSSVTWSPLKIHWTDNNEEWRSRKGPRVWCACCLPLTEPPGFGSSANVNDLRNTNFCVGCFEFRLRKLFATAP